MDRSNGFALTVAAISLIAAMMVAAVMLAVFASAPAHAHCRERFVSEVNDVPITDYAGYATMMQLGATTVRFDGRDYLVEKSDFTISELRALSMMLRVP